MKSPITEHNLNHNDIKRVLSPRQFVSQMPGAARVLITRTEAVKYITEYMRYRIERSQDHVNKYSESIGVLKSAISLLKNDHKVAAAIVLMNSGFNTHELTTRVSGIIDHKHNKTPKHYTLFIRQTLDGVRENQHYVPVKNEVNSYVILDGNPCPVVNMDDDSTVLCPFCNNRHKHGLRIKNMLKSKLPPNHFNLPCLSKHNAPLQMFDDTICNPKHGYFIENFKTLNSNEIIYKPKVK